MKDFILEFVGDTQILNWLVVLIAVGAMYPTQEHKKIEFLKDIAYFAAPTSVAAQSRRKNK